MNTEITNNGEKTMNYFFSSIKKNMPYDAIILDTHLSNPAGLDVAKRIRREKPDQKLVIVTTSPKEYLPSECLKTARVKDEEILTIPFRMSELGTALKN
jgi:DNA-binding response OmpR family regulator